MPYRIDIAHAGDDVAGRLIDLGAIDVETTGGGGVAALIPDGVALETLTAALGLQNLVVSPAAGRDADSVWVLRPPSIRIGRSMATLRLIDSPAFGTGLHPTTALCLEALQEAIDVAVPDRVLDVGTGSGVLALAALLLGVPHATGVDLDETALRAAAENARLNGLDGRLNLTRGGPDAVSGSWPLVLANVLAAPLIDMAPTLVRRAGHHGELVLSGIPVSVAADVSAAYRRLGMQAVRTTSRGGWAALIMRASW